MNVESNQHDSFSVHSSCSSNQMWCFNWWEDQSRVHRTHSLPRSAAAFFHSSCFLCSKHDPLYTDTVYTQQRERDMRDKRDSHFYIVDSQTTELTETIFICTMRRTRGLCAALRLIIVLGILHVCERLSFMRVVDGCVICECVCML